MAVSGGPGAARAVSAPRGTGGGGPEGERGGIARGRAATVFDSSSPLSFSLHACNGGDSFGASVPGGVDLARASSPATRKRRTSEEGKGREGAKEDETESFLLLFSPRPSIAHRCFSGFAVLVPLLLLLPPAFWIRALSCAHLHLDLTRLPPITKRTKNARKNSGRRAGAPSGWSGAPTATSCSRPTASRTRLTT